jgi:hypothetical protein
MPTIWHLQLLFRVGFPGREDFHWQTHDIRIVIKFTNVFAHDWVGRNRLKAHEAVGYPAVSMEMDANRRQ